ncbi:hypothetical protein BDC45DRAFT_530266 [Circinella umbellata]|nr:hypothetical protein BDC45DRAFT_530266 [Circinella umbellata]
MFSNIPVPLAKSNGRRIVLPAPIYYNKALSGSSSLSSTAALSSSSFSNEFSSKRYLLIFIRMVLVLLNNMLLHFFEIYEGVWKMVTYVGKTSNIYNYDLEGLWVENETNTKTNNLQATPREMMFLPTTIWPHTSRKANYDAQ